MRTHLFLCRPRSKRDNVQGSVAGDLDGRCVSAARRSEPSTTCAHTFRGVSSAPPLGGSSPGGFARRSPGTDTKGGPFTEKWVRSVTIFRRRPLCIYGPDHAVAPFWT